MEHLALRGILGGGALGGMTPRKRFSGLRNGATGKVRGGGFAGDPGYKKAFARGRKAALSEGFRNPSRRGKAARLGALRVRAAEGAVGGLGPAIAIAIARFYETLNSSVAAKGDTVPSAVLARTVIS